MFPVLVKNAIEEKTAIFNFTQNGTSQPIVSNSSNVSDWKRKIMYPIKISAFAGMTEKGIFRLFTRPSRVPLKKIPLSWETIGYRLTAPAVRPET